MNSIFSVYSTFVWYVWKCWLVGGTSASVSIDQSTEASVPNHITSHHITSHDIISIQFKSTHTSDVPWAFLLIMSSSPMMTGLGNFFAPNAIIVLFCCWRCWSCWCWCCCVMLVLWIMCLILFAITTLIRILWSCAVSTLLIWCDDVIKREGFDSFMMNHHSSRFLDLLPKNSHDW